MINIEARESTEQSHAMWSQTQNIRSMASVNISLTSI